GRGECHFGAPPPREDGAPSGPSARGGGGGRPDRGPLRRADHRKGHARRARGHGWVVPEDIRPPEGARPGRRERDRGSGPGERRRAQGGRRRGLVSAREILTLLDPDAMQRCLQAIPVFAERLARLGSVSFERLWAKPGRHFHVSYRVRMHADGGTVETLASAALLRADVVAADVIAAAVGVRSPERSPRHWSARLSAALLDTPRALVQLFP